MNNQDLQKEKELLEKAQNDSKQFDNIYKYFINDVYRFSYSILNNQHEAEDITSQTFIEFYKKLQSFEWQNISIKYWLFRTARNLSYKKISKQQPIEYDDDFHSEEAFDSISFVDEIMNKDLIEKVKEEIQKLRPQEQEVVNLRIWEGLSYVDIAQLQEISEDSARMRFNRSIAKVKIGLEQRNIKAFMALPALFTAMLLVGASPSYAAPTSMTSGTAFSTMIITKETNMTGLKSLLTSKIGVAAIAGTLLVVTAGGVAYGVAQNKKQQSDSQVAATTTPMQTATPTNTPIATITPTASATTIATPTPTPPPNIQVDENINTTEVVLTVNGVKTIIGEGSSPVLNKDKTEVLYLRGIIDADPNIYIYNIATKKITKKPLSDPGRLTIINFSPDYKYITTDSGTSMTREIRILESSNYREIGKISAIGSKWINGVMYYTSLHETPVRNNDTELGYATGISKFDPATKKTTIIKAPTEAKDYTVEMLDANGNLK